MSYIVLIAALLFGSPDAAERDVRPIIIQFESVMECQAALDKVQQDPRVLVAGCFRIEDL